MIPTLYSSGIFSFSAPFDALLGGQPLRLTCIAIRGFEDVYAEGEDVFAKYYAPNSLDEAVFDAQRLAKVSIITFAKESGELLFVPSHYVGNTAIASSVPYAHTVLSISLGNIPEALDLSFLMTELANVCSDTLGKTPTVAVHIAPTTDGLGVTPAQHASLEAARQALITNRDSVYARNLTLQTQIATLLTKMATLEQLVIDNDLATPAGP